MKVHVASVCVLALSVFAPLKLTGDEPNRITDAEKKAGWKLLFDGETLNGWRGFKKSGPPAQGWEVSGGVLTCVSRGKGGDIVTTGTFDDFELSWEWKMPPRSNNGVKYFITEERDGPIGHEYQLIDDALVKEDGLSSTASFYLIVAPKRDKKVKPSGEWNQSRILVQANHVEHWLNGEKVLEYECGAGAILDQVAKTKFKSTPGFGKKIRGHILLTYHNDECSFRNIKIRELAAK
jgi:hypothetical protein